MFKTCHKLLIDFKYHATQFHCILTIQKLKYNVYIIIVHV